METGDTITDFVIDAIANEEILDFKAVRPLPLHHTPVCRGNYRGTWLIRNCHPP